jgi:hypothetical protein
VGKPCFRRTPAESREAVHSFNSTHARSFNACKIFQRMRGHDKRIAF